MSEMINIRGTKISRERAIQDKFTDKLEILCGIYRVAFDSHLNEILKWFLQKCEIKSTNPNILIKLVPFTYGSENEELHRRQIIIVCRLAEGICEPLTQIDKSNLDMFELQFKKLGREQHVKFEQVMQLKKEFKLFNVYSQDIPYEKFQLEQRV